jgi:hypothetical protein
MDRGGRSKEGPPAPGESDAAPKQRMRRAVVNDMRRKIEQALGTADAAAELERAAEAVLMAAEAEQVDPDSLRLSALRTALARYRQARAAEPSRRSIRHALGRAASAKIEFVRVHNRGA